MQAEQNNNVESPDASIVDVALADDPLSASTVLQFLQGNPDFFNHHSEILPDLKIPHVTGGAVSLIEKQLSVYRRKCTALEDKLGELISVARENEQLHNRLHELIQEIISAASIDDIIALTRETLMQNFNADDVRFLMIDTKEGKNHQQNPERFLRYDEPVLATFEDNFNQRKTTCGIPTDEQREFLFDDEARVGSIAVIPLQYSRDIGVVILSSADPRRFDSNKGVMFLTELGEVLSRRVATFV